MFTIKGHMIQNVKKIKIEKVVFLSVLDAKNIASFISKELSRCAPMVRAPCS